MSTFTEQQRQTVVDMYLSGYNCKEIIMEIPTGTRTIQRFLQELGISRERRVAYQLAVYRGVMTYDHLKSDKKTRERRKTINPALRYKIFQRDNFRCQICGFGASDGVKLQVDHTIPVCEGGSNDLDNLRTCCLECNVGAYQINPVNKGKKKECNYRLTKN